VPADLPQLVELYSNVFQPAASRNRLRSALYEIFFGHPWVDDRLPSLVYQAATHQKISGCVGVMPRPMSLNGRPIRAAISHTVMVDPSSRPMLAAMELIRAFLSGGQDVSLAQGTDISRRIFEAVGGSTSLLPSLGWTRILHPSRYLLSFLERRGLPAAISAALRPCCQVTDWVTGRFARNPFCVAVPPVSAEELTAETLARCHVEWSHEYRLWPTYDRASLKWLIELLARYNGNRALTKILVRDASHAIVGWYLYWRRAESVGEVLQVAARPKSIGQVLDHLFSHAHGRGLLAMSGQLDARLLSPLVTRHCLINRGEGSWLLVHSNDPDIAAAVHRGDAFLTRLEAEWWIGFVLIGSLTLDTPKEYSRSERHHLIESHAVGTQASEGLHAVHHV
jgi:hypothetical protein